MKLSNSANVAVLLLKPDGYRSDSVRAAVEKSVIAHGLSIVGRYCKVMEAADVLDIWPRFAHAAFPVSRNFHRLYMTSGPCEIIVVEGSAVISACTEVKRSVRNTFGHGMFCNHIHTPVNEAERAQIVEKLAVCLPTGRLYARIDEAKSVEGVWGRMAEQTSEAIAEAADDVWRSVQISGWNGLRSPATVGKAVLSLHAGDPNSVDFGVSAIAAVFPSWGLSEIFSAYLQADSLGSAALACGTESELHVQHAVLHRLAMSCSLNS